MLLLLIGFFQFKYHDHINKGMILNEQRFLICHHIKIVSVLPKILVIHLNTEVDAQHQLKQKIAFGLP